MNTQSTWPGNRAVAEIFQEEIHDLNGEVSYRHITDEALFLRAKLPDCREVQQNDMIQHGVAVRTTESQIIVHPYTFREVCSNGAIHIDNITSKAVELGTSATDTAGVDFFFREAIQSCSRPEAFEANLEDMRDAMNRKVRLAIAMSSMARQGVGNATIDRIIARFVQSSDRSRYGLFNAITATARDEQDPEQKWKMESVGGGVFAWLRKLDEELERGNAAELPVTGPEKEYRSKADVV